jgi:hypothetical protein
VPATSSCAETEKASLDCHPDGGEGTGGQGGEDTSSELESMDEEEEEEGEVTPPHLSLCRVTLFPHSAISSTGKRGS